MKFISIFTSLILLLTFIGCENKKIEKKISPNKQDSTATDYYDNYERLKYSSEDSLADSKIKSYSIKLVSGKHKYGGKTKVKYENTLQLLNQEVVNAKRQMWTERELYNALSSTRSYVGGLVTLEVERNTIGAVNMQYYSMIIQDTTGKDLYRGGFSGRVGGHSSGKWWNLSLVFIHEKKIRPPFDIYIVDLLEDKPFKFTIRPMNY